MNNNEWQEIIVVMACFCVLLFSVVAFLGWF